MRILQILDYDIRNNKGDNNKWPCVADMFLLCIYTALSLFNLFIPLLPQKVLLFLGIPPSIPPSFSIIIIIINVIILIRVNLRLYIRKKDNIKSELKRLESERIVAKEITVNTWKNRFIFLIVGYVADFLITLYCIFYGSTVGESFIWIAVIAIVETLINDFVDNMEIMYEAVPNVYRKV